MKFKFKERKISVLILAVNFLFFFTILFNAQSAFSRSSINAPQKNKFVLVQTFLRTELFFGMNKQDGSVVTEDDWNRFLEETVTPRFPDGFTVLAGLGQFRDSKGQVIKENSRVLVLLYPLRARKSNNRKIEQIRIAYKKAFQQQSVLRMDFTQSVTVSF
jgi:hypothetical protein